MSMTVKITRKGQVTIPQRIREKLNSQIIQFDIVDDNVVIKPVKSVAGSLSSYAKKGLIPFEDAREKTWEEVVRGQHGEKTGRR
jgi:AbrB family looped-hinge helix DNA binding protein